jgi:prevent-host-death family protein
MSAATDKTPAIVVSALRARANFGQLLQRIEKTRQSLVIEKRGRPRAVLLSLQQYAKLAAPEPEVLRAIGAESTRNGTNAFSSRRIEQIIRSVRGRGTKG